MKEVASASAGIDASRKLPAAVVTLSMSWFLCHLQINTKKFLFIAHWLTLKTKLERTTRAGLPREPLSASWDY